MIGPFDPGTLDSTIRRAPNEECVQDFVPLTSAGVCKDVRLFRLPFETPQAAPLEIQIRKKA